MIGFLGVMEKLRDEKEALEDKLLEQDKEIEILNNQLKEKNNEIREYELLVFKVSSYLNCYQYFLESQEENNKKLANMIHEFSLKDSDKE